MVILDFFSDYPLVAAGLILIIVVVTTYLLLRWFLGRRMRRHAYECVEYIVRNCHEQFFYTNSDIDFVKYCSFYLKLNRHKSPWYYSGYNREFADSFCMWYQGIIKFKNRMSVFMSDNHYFSHSEYLSCVDGVNLSEATKQFLTHEFLSYVHKRIPDSLSSIKDYKRELERDFSDIPQVHNAKFVKEELERNKDYFDSVLNYPLDQQQRESIVKLEDNCLVISSAGSGKTSTSVAKIKYLVEKRNVTPSKILPLTYTRKAADELSERLNLWGRGLICHTFHSLAFRILAETTNERPDICDKSLMLQCFYHLIDINPDFKKAINSFLTEKSSLIKNEHDYSSSEDYYKDRAIYGIQAPFLDMDGRIIFTRSEEERKICTFLSMNNVSFRYEQPYFRDTATEFHRQYRPDFTIYFNYCGRDYFIILEHFGIDANNNVPRWFGEGQEGGYVEANIKYNEGIEWKRNVNRRYNTILIETTSAMFHDGTIYEKLEEQLRRNHIELRPLTEEEKFNKLVRRNQKMEDSILQLISTFITLMKSNRSTPDSILETIKKENPRRLDFIERSRFMLYEIFLPIYNEYQNTMAEKNQIDYTDLILKATDICEAGLYKREYDMILVDEFQDISVDRFKLLQSLRRQQPLTKLYCVGDDWQSIFRFSGSDLTLFNSFEDYFGFTEKCKIEKTYRFGEPLIKLSTKFILQNNFQVPKEICSNDDTRNTILSLVEYKKENGAQYDCLQSIVSSINHDETIMLVGRYHSDANFIPQNCILSRDQMGNITSVMVDGREMAYNTIHSAKGLEADNIILVNCSQEGNGFPSKISDDPILGYVLSKPESYPFAEERRLFYVAITRAKKHAYVLYKETCPSPFIKDIGRYMDAETSFDDKMICPWCGNGNLRSVSEGTNSNGTMWRVYRCNNNTAGCQYSWTVSFRNEESIIRQFRAVCYRSRNNNIVQNIGSMANDIPVAPSPSPPPVSSVSNQDEEGSSDDLPF